MIALALQAAFVCNQPLAVDGDTFRCKNVPVRIRLKDIDTPEMPGHCRRGRKCVPGNPYAAKAALARILASGRVTCRHLGFDRYQRVLARCQVQGRDIGRAMIAGGWAVEWGRG
jgi:micrococcal nuclease